MRLPLLLCSPESAEPRTPRPGSLHSSHFCSSPGEVAARGSTISSSNSCMVTPPLSPNHSTVNMLKPERSS